MFPMPLPPRKILLSLYSNNCRNFFMGFKDFLLMKWSASSPAHKYVHLLHSCSPSSQTLSLPSKCRKNLRILAPPMHFCPSFQRVYGCSYAPYSAMPISRPVNGEDVVTLEKQFSDQRQLMMLKQKLQEIGIDGSECIPGRYSGLMCPSCNSGDKRVKSLSLCVSEDGGETVWICCRSKCGWKGNTSAFAKAVSKIKKPKMKQPTRIIDEKSLGLEPLGNELIIVDVIAKSNIL